MENRDSKTPKLKSSDGDAPPIKTYTRRRKGSSSGPQASASSDSSTDLSKYLRWAEPKPDSSTALNTPVKVEEDVTVVDEIPAPKSSKGGSKVKTKLPSHSGGSSDSTTLPSAGGGVIKNIKPEEEVCLNWKYFGTCKKRKKCKMLHPQELQGTPYSAEIKHEVPVLPSHGKNISPIIKPQSSSAAEEATNKPQSSSAAEEATSKPQSPSAAEEAISKPQAPSAAEEAISKPQSPSAAEEAISKPQSPSAAEEAIPSPLLPAEMALSTAPVQVKHPSGSAIPSSTGPEARQRGTYWSPLDDGIKINLPHTKDPSKEEVDRHIEEVLSGTKSGKRFSAFEDNCPK